MFLVIASSLSGCSDAPYDLAPVHGTVLLDGEPLTEGKVRFAPIAQSGEQDAGRAAFGVIQSDGSFELGTFDEGDGAIVGEHWVTVYGPDAVATGMPDGDVPQSKFDKVAVPDKKAVQADSDNDVRIEITSELVAKFRRTSD